MPMLFKEWNTKIFLARASALQIFTISVIFFKENEIDLKSGFDHFFQGRVKRLLQRPLSNLMTFYQSSNLKLWRKKPQKEMSSLRSGSRKTLRRRCSALDYSIFWEILGVSNCTKLRSFFASQWQTIANCGSQKHLALECRYGRIDR